MAHNVCLIPAITQEQVDAVLLRKQQDAEERKRKTDRMAQVIRVTAPRSPLAD